MSAYQVRAGAAGWRLYDSTRGLAVAEARLAVLRLRLGDWAGAHESAVRAEAEATLVEWAPMVGAARRLQARAAQEEAAAEARAAYGLELISWGLF